MKMAVDVIVRSSDKDFRTMEHHSLYLAIVTNQLANPRSSTALKETSLNAEYR